MAIPMAILAPVIAWAIKALSSTARTMLQDALKEWYIKALATPGKMDDIAAKALCTALAIDVSGVAVGPNNIPTEIVDAIVGGITEVATGANPFAPPGNELGGP